MDYAKIYLCKSDRSILGTLTGIKTDTCNLKKNATDFWEITFEVERFVEKNGTLVQSDYYDSVDEMMKLYLDSDDNQAFFVIDSEPVIQGDGLQEVKIVTAHSIECELSNIYLNNLKINCGTFDSQEYLATDDEGNFNNIDDYTGLPKEYISLVNYDNHQLSLIHLALQGTDWTVKDDIDPEVCLIKKSFESSDSIYSFLMKTVSSAASVMFEFDRKYRHVGIVKAENFGKDTGIFITMRNLMNSFEVTSSSDDSIMTKLVPTGANNIGIEQVNFGKDYIINLDYFMNTLNEYGDYKFVSTELHNKYNTWKNYRETEKVIYDENEFTRRELYIELTKLYNQTILEINELRNRLPNDGCVIDYKTFSLEELKASLNAYNKALNTLITLYKNEYDVTEIGDAPDYLPTPSSAINIKDTPYWYDFYAYKEKIIPQVEESLKMYCQTDSNGDLVIDEDGHFIELEFGNSDYYTNEAIIKNIDAYLYEWSLYGLDELESKKKAWSECANVLYNECFIASGTTSSPTYRTADDNGWDSLSDDQKKEFTSKDAFINKLNQYLDYMSFDTYRSNSITNTTGKGIIRQCEDAITERKNEIADIETKQKQYNSQRMELADSVTLENFKVDGVLLFIEKDLDVIRSMLRTKSYSNEYILTTNLDDVVSTVDKQEELYQEAIKELDKISQPQYSFNTELDNLYALEEFKSYREPFEVGNFIRAGLEIHEDLYDNNYIKLRLISIAYNPLEKTQDLSVEFSTMTKSLEGISDLAFLMDKESSSGSTSSSSSSSSGGTYGNNDADVQISNNMLNALLKTEMFGTAVTDVILDSMKANKGNFNTLFSHSGTFDVLETGQIKISGDCLFDRIKSNNWNGTDEELIDNTVGSIIDLSDGTFNFGGGKLTWDGTDLYINGNGKFTGDISGSNGTFNGTLNGCDGIFKGSLNVNDNFIVDKNGNVVANGTLKATNADITGTIHAKNSIITESTLTGSDIAANTLTANNGIIAGWNFNSNAFYKNSASIGDSNGKYIGDDGLSVGDFFVVKENGLFQKNRDFTTEQYSTTMNIYNLPLVISDDDVSYNINNGGYIVLYFINVPKNTYFGFKFNIRLNVHYTDSDGSIVYTSIDMYKFWNWNTNLLEEKDNVSIIENDYNDIDNSNVVKMKINYNSLMLFGSGSINGHAYTIDSRNIYAFENSNSNENYTSLQIKKFEAYDSNDNLIYEFSGTKTNRKKGFLINSFSNEFMINNIMLSNNQLSLYDDCKFSIKETSEGSSYVENEIVSITKDTLKHNGLSTSSSGDNLVISSGNFYKKSSSSKRYKNTIQLLSSTSSLLSPHNLYNIDIISFRYNDDYLPITDQRYQQDIPGFIAEDVYKKYPIACNLDSDGKPEMWDINIMFPAALALIQEQHKDIESLKEKIEILKEEINN